MSSSNVIDNGNLTCSDEAVRLPYFDKLLPLIVFGIVGSGAFVVVVDLVKVVMGVVTYSVVVVFGPSVVVLTVVETVVIVTFSVSFDDPILLVVVPSGFTVYVAYIVLGPNFVSRLSKFFLLIFISSFSVKKFFAAGF